MNKLFLALLIVSSILLSFYACSKLPCEKLTCFNKTIKVFDSNECYCICLKSTTGTNCEVNLVDSLSGFYSEVDSCSSVIRTKKIMQVDSSKFTIENLGNITCAGSSYTVNIAVVDTIVRIDSQLLCPGAGNYLLYGAGNVDYITNKINIRYFVSYSVAGVNQIDRCDVFYLKN